ncbi:MAG: NAD(P)-binding protein [Chloroflexi bacterium]|nr:NAD(P)-binding protein [Chloroflexota bacterium]
MKQVSYDVVVIGSGAGGLCAGALLAHSGYKTLVVEKLALMGGRCSTIEYKGFKLGTGVVYTPTGEGLAHVFREVNVPYPLRPVPPEDARYRIEGQVYQPPPKGVLGWLMSRVDEAGANRLWPPSGAP